MKSSRASAPQGKRQILVVPISFVSDHIETLHEVNVEVREQAAEAGVEQFEMMPGLNDSPRLHRRARRPGAGADAAPVSR